MSRENVEIARRVIEANRPDAGGEGIATARERWHPTCEVTSHLASVEPRTYRGYEGLRRYAVEMAESFAEWHNEIEEVVEPAPNTVVAIIRSRVVGKASGVPAEARLVAVFVFSEGRILRCGTYSSREQALEAVGLRE